MKLAKQLEYEDWGTMEPKWREKLLSGFTEATPPEMRDLLNLPLLAFWSFGKCDAGNSTGKDGVVIWVMSDHGPTGWQITAEDIPEKAPAEAMSHA